MVLDLSPSLRGGLAAAFQCCNIELAVLNTIFTTAAQWRTQEFFRAGEGSRKSVEDRG